MFSLKSFLFAGLAASAAVSATPVDSTKKIHFKRQSLDVHCGTTADATFSDCQELLNNVDIWNANFNTGNTCTFNNPLTQQFGATAYNLACHNDCCVYMAATASNSLNPDNLQYQGEDVRQTALTLLGCGDAGSNKINVMGKGSGAGICISSGNGCSDCFDDSDFV